MAKGHDYLYSDIPETLYVEGLSAGTDTIDLTVTSTDKTFKGITSNSNFTNNGILGNATDAVKATAVSGNLTLEGVAEKDELHPGGFVQLNDDDDNSNGSICPF